MKKKNKKNEFSKYRFKWETIIENKIKERFETKNNCFIKNRIYEKLFKGYPEEYVDFYLDKYKKINYEK